MEDIQQIDEMIVLLRSLKSDIKKLNRLSEKAQGDLSPKQAERINADMNWLCMEMEKTRRSAHAVAVDLDIADLRRTSYYAPYEARPSGFHRYLITPRKPIRLAEVA